jgi:type II secretion system protein N
MPRVLESRVITSLVYSLYVLLLFFFLSYYLFPYDKFALYLLRSHFADAPLKMELSTIKPGFPPLTFIIPHIAFRGNGEWGEKAFAHLTRLAVRPSILSLARGDIDLSMRADAYGGRLWGRFRGSGSSDFQWSGELSLAEINLSLWEETRRFWEGALSGSLDAHISFSGNPAQWSNSSTGAATIKVREGKIEGLDRLLIPVGRLEKCMLEVATNLSEGLLKIERCRMSCMQGSAEAKGVINLATEVSESSLDLTVKASLDPQTVRTSGIPFSQLEVRIKGTLGNPRIEFPGPSSFPR